MTKKILAVITACICLATGLISAMGCTNTHGKMSEKDWIEAWKSTNEATNYSCKYEYFEIDVNDENSENRLCDTVMFENNQIDYSEKKDFKAHIICADKYVAYSYFKYDEPFEDKNGYMISPLQTFVKRDDESEWTATNGCNCLLYWYFPPNSPSWMCGAGTGNGDYPENYDIYEKEINEYFAQQGSLPADLLEEKLKSLKTVGLPADFYDYFVYDKKTDSYTATLFCFNTLNEQQIILSFDGGKLKTFAVAYENGEIYRKTTFYDYGKTEVIIPQEIINLP